MSHLPTERLAALVDETPTADEAVHLAECAECARERAAYRSVADLATAESSRIGMPLTNWETLRPALVADGVIDTGRGFEHRARPAHRAWLQAAAAVLFAAGGVAGGRYSAGASVLPNVKGGVTRAAASSSTTEPAPTFASIEEARAAQERSQVMYQSATAFLAQRDTSTQGVESTASMRTRLAALDQANQVMGAALSEAPYDPVINGYYLTTLGQREATLRQINTTMPASMRVISY